MAVPWLTVGKLVLSNLDTVMEVVKPVFTRKKIDAGPIAAPTWTGATANPADLLNQQIAELQAAASNNAEQIKALAAQLKEIVTALDKAAVEVAAERARTRRLCWLSIVLSVAALLAASKVFFSAS